MVQELIRSRFVAAWESVRPVPRVSIDFGNGRKLERTLNGNVATYVCDPEGRVVDVIPGVCDPATYVKRLEEALDLYALSRADFATVPQEHARLAELARYEEVARSTRGRSAPIGPPVPVAMNGRAAPHPSAAPIAPTAATPPTAPAAAQSARRFYSKSGVELPLKTALGVADDPPRAPARTTDIGKRAVEFPMKDALGVEQELLAADAEVNARWRDPAVHALLARAVVRPSDITKQLYREVLHVDLDDPYLGLAGGPFAGGAYGGLDVRDGATTR
jgi:hypothetical protein